MQGALSCSLHQNLALYGSQFLIYDALQILNNFTYFLLCLLGINLYNALFFFLLLIERLKKVSHKHLLFKLFMTVLQPALYFKV